jgi:hypothetical protein
MENTEVLGTQSNDTQAPVNNDVASAPVDPAPQQSAEEKKFSQAEVGSLVNRKVREAERAAYEKAQRDFQAAQQKTVQQSQTNNLQAQQQQGQQQQLTQADIERIADQKFNAKRDELVAMQTAYEFDNKMQAGKNKYQDFDEVVGDLNYSTMLPIVQWANAMDNTADIMYDIAKNPAKLSNVMNLANAGQQQLAYKELQKLSQSIKANEAAAKVPKPNAPLSQLQASHVSPDNGESDVSGLRKQSWLRG